RFRSNAGLVPPRSYLDKRILLRHTATYFQRLQIGGAVMSVRKRAWTTRRGERKEAWVADYTDQSGTRHLQTFERKKDADAYHATAKVDVRRGTHTAPSKSITVSAAGTDWLTYVEAEGRERTTLDQYRQHVRLHIEPALGKVKLAHLTTPRVE